jgi:pyruvate dehydrogenase E1 component beta subunit
MIAALTQTDDRDVQESVKKTGKLIVADEGTVMCGAESEVSEIVAEEAIEYLQAPILSVGPPETPVPFSPPLERLYVPNGEAVSAAVKKMKAYL